MPWRVAHAELDERLRAVVLLGVDAELHPGVGVGIGAVVALLRLRIRVDVGALVLALLGLRGDGGLGSPILLLRGLRPAGREAVPPPSAVIASAAPIVCFTLWFLILLKPPSHSIPASLLPAQRLRAVVERISAGVE